MNAIDAATEGVGLHGNWLGVRFALGLVLGVAEALLISSSISREDLSPAKAGSS
jgi:hypothetical protein